MSEALPLQGKHMQFFFLLLMLCGVITGWVLGWQSYHLNFYQPSSTDQVRLFASWRSPRGDMTGIRTPPLLNLRASCDAENAQPAPLRLMAALEKSMHQKLHKGNFLCSWQGDPFDAVAVAKAKNPKKARTNDMFCDAVDSLGIAY